MSLERVHATGKVVSNYRKSSVPVRAWYIICAIRSPSPSPPPLFRLFQNISITIIIHLAQNKGAPHLFFLFFGGGGGLGGERSTLCMGRHVSGRICTTQLQLAKSWKCIGLHVVFE